MCLYIFVRVFADNVYAYLPIIINNNNRIEHFEGLLRLISGFLYI